MNNADVDVLDLSQARERPSVHKINLMNFREDFPDDRIFVFEGPDDSAAYYQWFRAIDSSLNYEPYVCKNKSQVLKCYKTVKDDRSGLGDDVYFFVDRDFDDLTALEDVELDDTLFMTDQYAIENYLVERSVVEKLLKTEFHCGTQPQARERILTAFDTAYGSFLDRTREMNRRLFISQRGKIDLKTKPEKIGELAIVGLEQCHAIAKSPELLVIFKKEPDQSRLAEWDKQFQELEPRQRYRGKWAFLFFLNWLKKLADDRRSDTSQFFDGADRSMTTNESAITLQICASKSTYPTGLEDFIHRIVR